MRKYDLRLKLQKYARSLADGLGLDADEGDILRAESARETRLQGMRDYGKRVKATENAAERAQRLDRIRANRLRRSPFPCGRARA